VLAAVVAVGGCGGGAADTAACASISAEIRNITDTGMKQVNDPQKVATTYHDGAAKIRAEGKKAGGDVETAAGEVATAMEGLGKAVASGSGQLPDTSPLISATTKLQGACA
jgi:hypothetical protein